MNKLLSFVFSISSTLCLVVIGSQDPRSIVYNNDNKNNSTNDNDSAFNKHSFYY